MVELNLLSCNSPTSWFYCIFIIRHNACELTLNSELE